MGALAAVRPPRAPSSSILSFMETTAVLNKSRIPCGHLSQGFECRNGAVAASGWKAPVKVLPRDKSGRFSTVHSFRVSSLSSPCRHPWRRRAASQEGAWTASASSQPESHSPKSQSQNGRRVIPISPPIQRRLILLRHAKSSWDDPSLRDHDRPLASRGRKAAKRIATKLAEEGWIPELILCSDSTRTKQTLEHMCEAVPELREVPVKFLGSYYSVAAMDGQTASHLQETVVKYAGLGIGTVMCMGHNRGWEEAASEFAQEEVELKTAHGALLESDREHSDWATAFADHSWNLYEVLKPDMTVGSGS